MKEKLPQASLKFKASKIDRFVFQNPSNVHDYVRKMFDKDTLEYSESFVVVYLNRANETIAWTHLSSGGLNSCEVDSRKIFMNAILSGASGIVLAHNHPSGKLKASTEDISITSKIKQGCALFNIALIDHLIITSESYLSMADEGLI